MHGAKILGTSMSCGARPMRGSLSCCLWPVAVLVQMDCTFSLQISPDNGLEGVYMAALWRRGLCLML